MTPEQLKASILQRAMEGKLVPQDPNDEPASELLKRIKAEKEKLIKEGKIKRDKNETEIFRGDDGLHYEKFQDGSVKQIDVPYEIPESWEWVSLEQISQYIQRGKSPKYVSKSSIPIISQKSIQWSGFDLSPSKFLDEKLLNNYDPIRFVQSNDLLWCSTGKGTVGRVTLFTDNYKNGYKHLVVDSHVTILRMLRFANPKFVLEYLSSPIIQDKIDEMTTGSTKQTELNLSTIKKTMVPFPPENEQKRILKKIEILFKKNREYNKYYTQNIQINSEFPEKLRKSILQYAMQGKLVPQDATDEAVEVLLEKIREEKQRLFKKGKLKKKDLQESIIYQGDDNSYYENCPNTWAKVTLTTISKITSGGTPKTDLKEYYNGEIPWFTPADLSKAQSNYYLNNSLKSITRLGLKNSSAQLIDAYSIVYSSRAPIGYINIVPKQYTTNQGCKSLTPYLVIVKWLYFAMKYATADIKKHASGTTFLEISASKLGDFYIDLPPINEQERIVNKIEKLWNKIDTLPFTL